MTEEKFVFVSDVREKKSIAASSFRKVRNGGSVKFPSDYLTKKELNAMNGEVKAYRLNEPMKWAEFKEMPDDIKISYVNLIRERFRVSDTAIASMLGITQSHFSDCVKTLGISLGRHRRFVGADRDGFIMWVNGISASVSEETVEETAEEISSIDVIKENEPQNAVICSGELTIKGSAKTALEMISLILGNANVRLTVSWDELEGGC